MGALTGEEWARERYNLTWADVDLLRTTADEVCVHPDDDDDKCPAGNLYRLADRIAALLPPREET